MNNAVFSGNLRRLRLEKGMTQEQLANTLGVSPQSVSRWECGNTLPDVMMLPPIARVYGVTVDDLYQEEIQAYPSYAQRLLAVYETSGRLEDFVAAEQEFLRMNTPTPDDLRAWGVLYHYMMSNSAACAQQKLEQAMAHPGVSEQVYVSAAQQRILLLCFQGKGAAEAARYDRELDEKPDNPMSWVLCAAAHEFMEDYDRALEIARDGIGRFPDHAMLHIHAGDICRALKRFDEAFSHWQRALELDPDHLDAAYSMGFCHEELGQFDRALRIWEDLTGQLDRRGLVMERKLPARRAEYCRNML